MGWMNPKQFDTLITAFVIVGGMLTLGLCSIAWALNGLRP